METPIHRLLLYRKSPQLFVHGDEVLKTVTCLEKTFTETPTVNLSLGD